MGTIKNAVYKVDNGTDFDEIHFKTKAAQVICSNGKTAEAQLAEIVNLIPKITTKNIIQYRPESQVTSPGATIALGEKGVYLVNAYVFGNGNDHNHSATGTWLVKWLGGGTYKILSAELLGTVQKVGNAQELTLTHSATLGSIYIKFTQANATSASFIIQIIKLGEGEWK